MHIDANNYLPTGICELITTHIWHITISKRVNTYLVLVEHCNQMTLFQIDNLSMHHLDIYKGLNGNLK